MVTQLIRSDLRTRMGGLLLYFTWRPLILTELIRRSCYGLTQDGPVTGSSGLMLSPNKPDLIVLWSHFIRWVATRAL